MKDKLISTRWIVVAVLAVLTVATIWFLRPLGIIHGPVMFFYQYPLLWMLPLVTALLIALVTFISVQIRKARDGDTETSQDIHFHRASSHRGSWGNAAFVGAILVPTAFIVALFIAPVLTGQAIYNKYGPFDKTDLPANAQTRIMPKTVALTLARNGFASPTETLENAHIIRSGDELQWTFGQSPDGAFRRITKKTAGSAALDANATSRKLSFYRGEFEVGPGHVWADSVTWKAYKRNFFSDVAESIYLPGRGGGKILVPYIEYEGFFVKVPVLGGAYLISPDGTIEDLSPEDAASHPDVQAAGRLFPSELARRIQDSFVYVNGIWNRVFTHRDILTVEDRADGDPNKQPHYIVAEGEGQWVSVGEPWGRADAVGGVFFTDAITGETNLWRSSQSAGLTSSRRAQDATEALAIPGVSFRGGDFRAIEPRPVFRDGKMLFLVSIAPKGSSTVSKSVIIEPRNNKAVAVFSHTDDPSADERLLAYLSGESVGVDTLGDSETNSQGAEGESQKGVTLSQSERDILEDLLRQNESQRQALLDLLQRVGR